MPLQWESQIQLDTTGMSPEYIDFIRQSLTAMESSKAGLSLRYAMVSG